MVVRLVGNVEEKKGNTSQSSPAENYRTPSSKFRLSRMSGVGSRLPLTLEHIVTAIRFVTGILILLQTAAGVCAGDAQQPQIAGAASAPVHGSETNIYLGRGETLFFVWIEPLGMWVGKHEVTNGQYGRYDPEHDSNEFQGYRLNERNQPVVRVSWNDAHNYCSWLTRRFGEQLPGGLVFRLPYEDEWQAFASCGDSREFPWGGWWPPPDDWNYRGEKGARLVFRLLGARDFIEDHQNAHIVSCPVDQSGSNEWSLCGVGGNVWEWCGDWFDTNHLSRVTRGASWSNYRRNVLAITNRTEALPSGKTEMVGFRVVIGPEKRADTPGGGEGE